MSLRSLRSLISIRSLTPQLFVFVVLPLTLLLLLIAFAGTNLHQQAMRSLVGERDQRAVQSVARTLQEQIQHRATAVQTLALRAQDNMSTEALASLVVNPSPTLPEFDTGLAFLARGGSVLASSGETDFWNALPNLPDFQDVIQRDVPPTFTQVTHPATSEVIVLILATTYKGGPVAAGAFSPSAIAQQAMTDVFVPSESSVAFILDSSYRILFQIGDLTETDSIENHPGVQEALSGANGASFSSIGGSEHVVAFSQVEPVGWAVIIEEPWEAVASPLLRTTENLPLVLVPAFLLSILALWFGLAQIVQPLQELGSRASLVGWGNYEAIEQPVGGIAEIRKLQMDLVHLSRKIKAAQQGLRGYIGAITSGQEEERRRLARELHDDTIQALVALNQRVQLAQLALQEGQTEVSLDEIRGLITQTLENLRRITRALRPIYLDELGLVAALETLVSETRTSSHLEISFHVTGNHRRLSAVQELALYRISQEALNNVLHHAQAETCTVSLVFEADLVRLQIQDDGCGFEVPDSPAELVPHEHFGLLGLHERAELIGAALRIDSKPGEGTRIEVRLEKPFSSKQAISPVS